MKSKPKRKTALAKPRSLEQDCIREMLPLYRKFQRKGKEFESARKRLHICYLKWQAKFKAQGSRTGGGFKAVLERHGISRATVYRLLKAPDLVSTETKSLPPAPAKREPITIEADPVIARNIGLAVEEIAATISESVCDVINSIDSLTEVAAKSAALSDTEADKVVRALDDCCAKLKAIRSQVSRPREALVAA